MVQTQKTRSEDLGRSEKMWGRSGVKTALILLYSGSAKFGCVTHPWMRGASKYSLSCSEFSAFDFFSDAWCIRGCVAHPMATV